MTRNLRKYRLSEIYIGMKIIDKSQLSNIYDKWIILAKQNEHEEYTIRFIGDETNTQSDKLFNQGLIICPVYNDSIELEGDVYFDE